MRPCGPTRIVILGGGFGGLYAALHLQKACARGRVQLTVVNRDNHFLFTPMLHEVAASDIDITHIVNPIRKLVRQGVFFAGEVEEIDLPSRRVVVSHAGGAHRHTLSYDQLVIALGSVTNFFGLPGLQVRASTMKTLGDAIALRNRLIQLLEEADFECAAANRHNLLTVLVAGGGFAGVETVAAINDFLRDALPYYRHLAEKDLRVVLVHPESVILPELSESLGRYAQHQLARRGVEIRVDTAVTGVSDRGVELSDGSTIDARTLVWTAGTSANPMLAGLPCEKVRGRIRVNEYLEVPGWPGVWALGDCAAVPDPRTGGIQPPTAQHALRQGRLVAENILAAVDALPKKPFTFATLGQLAAIGRRTGVANILGVNFSGFIAWWLWRTIYLSKLPRFERKVRVALDWTLDLFFSKDLVQFQTFRDEALNAAESRDGETDTGAGSPVEAPSPAIHAPGTSAARAGDA